MNEFMQRYELVISTLSPVHIGCGEDYEPTNYVINQQNELCVFGVEELVRGLDKSERDNLLVYAQSDDALNKIKKLLDNNKNRLSEISTKRIPLAKIIRPGKPIERHSFNPYTNQPILPGSSIKGAIRTALINSRQNLLGISIPDDPFRFIKISDAHYCPKGGIPPTRIFDRANLHKIDGTPSSARYGTFVECIDAIQQRCFKVELEITQDISINQTAWKIEQIAAGCNAFYSDRMRDDVKYLNQMGRGEKWIATMKQQVFQTAMPDGRKTMGALLGNNSGFLLRVGKHSGAESLTLDGCRKIKTKHGIKEVTSAMPLAKHDEGDGLLRPFGWLFVQVKAL